MLTKANMIRRCRFSPFIKGAGPTFTLSLFETGRRDGSRTYLGYRLTITDKGSTSTLFEGEDYGCSTMHCLDSDEAVSGIMGFLTLRKGDTDADYFKDYTPAQLAYCEQWAEALACCVSDRFDPEN